jgi:hypothetical protein
VGRECICLEAHLRQGFYSHPPPGWTALVSQVLLTVDVSRSHSIRHTHSLRLLWTSDRPVTETALGQITTLTRGRHPCPGGIQPRDPSKRGPAAPRLRPRGLWDRPFHPLYLTRHTVVLILLSNMRPAVLGMRRTY